MINPSSHIGAASALIGASYVGLKCDSIVPNSGIAGTLIVAGLLSNSFTLVPTLHPLYDICWSHILPASLALLLLGYRSDGDSLQKSSSTNQDTSSSAASSIFRLFIPFLTASFGSLLGCFMSFKCSQALGWLTLANAKAATACLSASYVGGSVNYFATGRMINASSDLLGSLATADLLVMAIYFSFLSMSLDWKWLRSRFYVPSVTADDSSITVPSTNMQNTKVKVRSRRVFVSKTFAGIALMGFSLCIAEVSNWVERMIQPWVPGTGSAVIAICTPIINSLINSRRWFPTLSETANQLGGFLFLCFFASIGFGCDLRGVVGLGPACLCFATLAILIHLVVALVGSSTCARRLKIELEDVWIASNAAIGGPATAAAFCSRLNGSSNLRGKTLAATFYGCAGYAIGTTLGSLMFRFVGG
ncbi:unnamed protein product [Cylindrotheca closterium]|uniref:DUF819 domain-containing protein n=1 Tax=Cylindrotheca closterium TaxID=2856 RepID=A0AAD2CGG7_9STRA|nr:unnamed protein product [Cylindrotheca closterium]